MMEEAYTDSKLHEAVRCGDVDEVREALLLGHNPNQIGTYQWTALHEACSNGDDSIVQLLIKYGGDPNVQDLLRGSTAMHYAASEGHRECLRMLLHAGGKLDVLNNDGKSCVDVAFGECHSILQSERDKFITLNPLSKETLLENVVQDTQQSIFNQSPSVNSEAMKEEASVLYDFDEISVATSDSLSGASSWSQTLSWSSGEVVNHQRNLALGTALMSFEYNSKKSTFKARVWQISDLLLPPAESSMISGIYVKSYLQPDKRKDSKKKTEEISVSSPHISSGTGSSQSRSIVFKPSTFKFKKPLEYSKLKRETVETKVLEIVVCVVQKYTHKSYAIASWNIPLKEAVRKLLKEKYVLKPCLSLNIPENMKVYHAGQLQCGPNDRIVSASNPSLQRDSWAMPYHERCSSESALRDIRVENSSKASSIEITLPDEDDEDLNEALQRISVMEREERAKEDALINISNPPEDNSSVCGDGAMLTQVEVYVEPVSCTGSPESHVGVLTDEKNNHKVMKGKRGSDKKGRKSKLLEPDPNPGSRPDTPSWDHYSEPLSIGMVPLDFEDDLPHTAALPMAVTMDMPAIHSSFQTATANESTQVEETFSQASHILQIQDEGSSHHSKSPRDDDVSQMGTRKHSEPEADVLIEMPLRPPRRNKTSQRAEKPSPNQLAEYAV